MNRTDRVLMAMLSLGFVTGVAVAVTTGAFADRPQLSAPEVSAADAQQGSVLATSALAPSLPASEEARRTPVVEAVERVAPAVVTITTEIPVQSPFRFATTQKTSAQGSGVVIDASGIVLTNAHVVSQATKIEATFADGRSFVGEILGLDRDLDLAVLRLTGAQDLVPVAIGSSGELMLGEPVIAIGNPFGLGHTVTTGVVSSLHRAVETSQRVYQDFIQTDASINPGNSGGPLLDVRGRLIGINTAIYEEGQGIGFAIPSDRAMKIASDLLQFGGVVAPWLGCDLEDTALRLGGKVRTAALVDRIYPDSGASKAGLVQGDVLLSLDDKPVQGRADLNAYLAGFPPGRAVTLSLLRGNETLRLSLAAQAIPDAVVNNALSSVLGVTVSQAPVGPAPGDPARGRANGVLVTAVTTTGSFARAQLRAGDLIVAFNGEVVTSPDQLRQLVARAKSGHRPKALLTVQRGTAMGRFNLDI